VKRIVFSDQAKADIRAIPQQSAMQILTAIHRLAETNAGRVKTLKGLGGDKRLRVGDFRVRFTEESGEDEDTLRIHAVRNRRDAYR
jgi:mRNA-degrading endonuclease RelE of RelBE toxin-antitoxin system